MFDQAIKRDRELAYANTGGVPNGIRDRARRAGDADLAHAFNAERINVRIVLSLPRNRFVRARA